MRDLEWDGAWNARDLGGLRTRGGALTGRGQLIRSDSLDRLTGAGWRALEAYGVRTIIDLRDPYQLGERRAAPPASVAIKNLPIEQGLHEEPAFAALMRSGAWATSLYLGEFLRRWPARVARVLSAIAEAPPGGVVFHCKKGSDRTGLVSLALLAIAEVEPEEIVADYLRTAERLREHGARQGWPDDAAPLERAYERLGATPRAGVLDALEAWRGAEHRLAAVELERLRGRLVGP